MDRFNCASAFIQKMYQHQSENDLKLKIPQEIVPYTKNLIRLHNTPVQLLMDVQHWLNDWLTCGKIRKFSYMYNYDENDPDLMIDPIDNTKHRKTWAICFEAYLRRQLIILYSHPTIQNIENIILENVLLSLPTINPYTNDPDDIRAQQVKIKSFSLHGCTTQLIPPEYRHFTWYNKNKDIVEQLPKFRCRPALLNSMDCMTLLHDNMEIASQELMIKVAYYLRPFRFILPLTFMFDIFGGFKNTPAIENSLPDHAIRYRFPDATVLADEVECTFWEKFKNETRYVFSEKEVIKPRRANAFLAGGSVSYMLGHTNDFNDLDIYIEFDHEVFSYIRFLTAKTTTIQNPSTPAQNRLWVTNEHDYDNDDGEERKHKIPKNKNMIYTPPDTKIIFQNQHSSMVEIHSVYNLNPNLTIVKHWQAKYKHLPQIIFIKPKLKLNAYNILKMITSFDLAICRNALAFKQAKAFHLRKPIIEKLYGFKQMNEIPDLINFVNTWETDEENEFLRKMKKVLNFDNISPKERKLEYQSKRLCIKNNAAQKTLHIKQQRKMLLVKWPYDTVPISGVSVTKSKNRFEKYLKRVPNTLVDFESKRSLPIQVYPLKYLCYWELQKNIININQNCLCNFNYSIQYDANDNVTPSTSAK